MGESSLDVPSKSTTSRWSGRGQRRFESGGVMELQPMSLLPARACVHRRATPRVCSAMPARLARGRSGRPGCRRPTRVPGAPTTASGAAAPACAGRGAPAPAGASGRPAPALGGAVASAPRSPAAPGAAAHRPAAGPAAGARVPGQALRAAAWPAAAAALGSPAARGPPGPHRRPGARRCTRGRPARARATRAATRAARGHALITRAAMRRWR